MFPGDKCDRSSYPCSHSNAIVYDGTVVFYQSCLSKLGIPEIDASHTCLPFTLLPVIPMPKMTVFTASFYARPTWGCLNALLLSRTREKELYLQPCSGLHINTAEGRAQCSHHGRSWLTLMFVSGAKHAILQSFY